MLTIARRDPTAPTVAGRLRQLPLDRPTVKDIDLRETAASFGDGPYAVILDDAAQLTMLPAQQGFNDTPPLLSETPLRPLAATLSSWPAT